MQKYTKYTIYDVCRIYNIKNSYIQYTSFIFEVPAEKVVIDDIEIDGILNVENLPEQC